jgi:hypothetical protein
MATPSGTNTYLVKWWSLSPSTSGALLHEHTVRAARFVTGDVAVTFVDTDNEVIFMIRSEYLISIERTDIES